MDSNNFTSQFSDKARNDLNSIVEYIYELDSIAAERFVVAVNQIVNNLELFPEMGTLLNNDLIVRKNIRKIVIDNYVLYYLPDMDRKIITIISIIYGKRNTEEIIRQLNE